MSIFSSAINGFRSTASRAGKFYNSAGANKAKAVAGHMAYAMKVNPRNAIPIAAAAGVAGAGGAVVAGRDHRTSGAVKGAGLGAAGMVGYGAFNTWRRMGPMSLAGSTLKGLLR